MENRILITGGAGYIGSVLVPILLSKGYFITVLDNFMYKTNSLSSSCLNKNLDIISGDIRDEALVKNILGKHDIVFPLAAYVGAPLCDSDPYTSKLVNYEATINLFRFVSKNQRIIMPTTNSAYGTGDKNNFCDEQSSLNPISSYAKQKVEVENILMQNENSISFRLATVFGMSPRMRLDLLVNDFTYRACNDGFIVIYEGSFKRNYIHVTDVAQAFLMGLEKFDLMRGNIYNVGLSDANISKYELCQLIKNQLPNFYINEAELQKDKDQRNYIVSNKKIEDIGFCPKVSVHDGIKELIKGFVTLNYKPYRNI